MSNTKVEDPARAAIIKLLESNSQLRPQFIRLAFYDATSYDPNTKRYIGPHGSIRFWEGLAEDTKMNDALTKLDSLQIEGISKADLYQLAGILAVEKAGGPPIDFQYGRKDLTPKSGDTSKLQFISAELLQDFVPNWVDMFHHIGFTAKEIVALSLAPYYWLNDNPEQPIIDHSFYEKLLTLQDAISKTSGTTLITTTSQLHHWHGSFSNRSFLKHVDLFVKDPSIVGKEYAIAHKKLSELGFKYPNMKHGYMFALATTILIGFLGFFFEIKRA